MYGVPWQPMYQWPRVNLPWSIVDWRQQIGQAATLGRTTADHRVTWVTKIHKVSICLLNHGASAMSTGKHIWLQRWPPICGMHTEALGCDGAKAHCAQP